MVVVGDVESVEVLMRVARAVAAVGLQGLLVAEDRLLPAAAAHYRSLTELGASGRAIEPMGVRRQLTALLSAVYLAGAFLVPALHSAEPAGDHRRARAAHPGCVDCAHGALQAPCPRRGPCENPNHEHGGHRPGHGVPCPRCSGTFGATLAAAASVGPQPAPDLAQRLRIVDPTPVALLLPFARAARAPPHSS